jgi:hypothetical protein
MWRKALFLVTGVVWSIVLLTHVAGALWFHEWIDLDWPTQAVLMFIAATTAFIFASEER